MTQQSRRFEVVDDQAEPVAVPAPALKQPILNRVSVEMMSMALTALSQRALVALASCFTLLTVGSTFFLWWQIPAPSDRQIISLTIYAAFVLAINIIVRRK